MNYIPNLPNNKRKRVVIIGGGFAGLKLMRKLNSKEFQIIILDKNNFHQFQPLLYQVATSGLEPSAISFPLRKILQKEKEIHFRIAELITIHADIQEIETNIGRLSYDYLVLAMGAAPNYFGQKNIQRNTYSMKTASDAILIRNTILENLEQALLETDSEKISESLNIVLVGAGPTGVELAGAIAEMKNFIFPKDYPELDLSKMRIVIYEAAPRVLASMSEQASVKALQYLKQIGVEVYLNTKVLDYDGKKLHISDQSFIYSKMVIWAAGIKANMVKGLEKECYGRSGRICVDRFNRVKNTPAIFALGDLCIMETPKFPGGHPQVAQVAIQQAHNLGRNLSNLTQNKPASLFEYTNKGSLATIGKNLAVADLPCIKLSGFIAWVLWSFVHLFTIVGVKNRLSIFINWSWNYFTYDQSLRLLIKPKNHLAD